MSTDTHPPRTAVRASNAEREEIVARLHHALGEGRLDLAETEERVAAAYAATYRGELAPLLADLPAATASPGPVPEWSALWASFVWRARTVVLGPEAAGAAPTPAQCRTAALLTVLALVWMTVCAFLGAAMVGA
jgi:hypothetical protein